MLRSLKWMLPVTALAMMLGISATARAADEKVEGKGTIAGTVTGEDGKAVSGIEVRVMKPMMGKGPGKAKEQAAGDEKPARPEPVATATTDADGKFSVEVPAGSYAVVAGKKGEGMARQGKVEVKDGETTTIELTLKKGKGPGGEGKPGRKGAE